MSDYVPTTENIRQTFAYVQAGLDDDDGYPFVMHVHIEAFDCWLAEVERAAAEKALTEAADERERLHGLPNKTADWLRARAEAYTEGKLTK